MAGIKPYKCCFIVYMKQIHCKFKWAGPNYSWDHLVLLTSNTYCNIVTWKAISSLKAFWLNYHIFCVNSCHETSLPQKNRCEVDVNQTVLKDTKFCDSSLCRLVASMVQTTIWRHKVLSKPLRTRNVNGSDHYLNVTSVDILVSSTGVWPPDWPDMTSADDLVCIFWIENHSL